MWHQIGQSRIYVPGMKEFPTVILITNVDDDFAFNPYGKKETQPKEWVWSLLLSENEWPGSADKFKSTLQIWAQHLIPQLSAKESRVSLLLHSSRKGKEEMLTEMMRALPLPVLAADNISLDNLITTLRSSWPSVYVVPMMAPPWTPPQLPREGLWILMGQQGSGKSTLITSQAQSSSNPWIIIDEKEAGWIRRGVKKALIQFRQDLKSGRPIVIDATSPRREDRLIYINEAKAAGVQYHVGWLMKPGFEGNAQRPEPVPEIALRIYASRLEVPKDDEHPVRLR